MRVSHCNTNKQTAIHCTILHHTKKSGGGKGKLRGKGKRTWFWLVLTLQSTTSGWAAYMYIYIYIYIYTHIYADQSGQRGHRNITMFWSILTCSGSTWRGALTLPNTTWWSTGMYVRGRPKMADIIITILPGLEYDKDCGVATISRLLKTIGLFCKRAL